MERLWPDSGRLEREGRGMGPELDEPDDLGIALLKDGPSAYAIGSHGMIVFGIHTTCDGTRHGVIHMRDMDDVFNLVARCAGCGMEYHFTLDNIDMVMDFTSWSMSMISRTRH